MKLDIDVTSDEEHSRLQQEVLRLLHSNEHAQVLRRVFVRFSLSYSEGASLLGSTGTLRLLQQTAFCPDVVSCMDILMLYEDVIEEDMKGLNYEQYLVLLSHLSIQVSTVNCRYRKQKGEYQAKSLVKVLLEQLRFCIKYPKNLRSEKQNKKAPENNLRTGKQKTAIKESIAPAPKTAWVENDSCKDKEYTTNKSSQVLSQAESLPLSVSLESSETGSVETSSCQDKEFNTSLSLQVTSESESLTLSEHCASSSEVETNEKYEAVKEMNISDSQKRETMKQSLPSSINKNTKADPNTEDRTRMFLVRNALYQKRVQAKLERLRNENSNTSENKVDRSSQAKACARLMKSRQEYFEKHKEKFDKLKYNDVNTGQELFKPKIMDKRKTLIKANLYERALEKQRKTKERMQKNNEEIAKEQNKSRISEGSSKYINRQISKMIMNLFEKYADYGPEGFDMSSDMFLQFLKKLSVQKIHRVMSNLSILLDPEKIGFVDKNMFKLLLSEAVQYSEETPIKTEDEYLNHIIAFGKAVRRYYMNNRVGSNEKKESFGERKYAPELCPRSRRLDRIRERKLKEKGVNKPRVHALYEHASEILTKRMVKKKENERKDMEECSFKPNLEDSKKKLKELPPRLPSKALNKEKELLTSTSQEEEEVRESTNMHFAADQRGKRRAYSLPAAKSSDFHSYPKSYYESVRRLRDAHKEKLKHAQRLKEDKTVRFARDPATGNTKVIPFTFLTSKRERIKSSTGNHSPVYNYARVSDDALDINPSPNESPSNVSDIYSSEEEKEIESIPETEIMNTKGLLFVCNVRVQHIGNNGQKTEPTMRQIPVYREDKASRLSKRFAALYDISSKAQDDLTELLGNLIEKFQARSSANAKTESSIPVFETSFLTA